MPRELQTIDMPPLSLRADVGTVDVATRSVDLIWSTGADVPRYDWMSDKKYIERLSMNPAHVRLGRLNAGAPLLDSHSAWSVTDQLGAVERGSAKVAKGLGTAKVRFSKREAVEGVFQDVIDKIVTAVSVGYRVHKFEEDTTGPIPVRTAIDWEPYEVSMVPMPADPGARVRKDDKVAINSCVVVPRESAADADGDRLRNFRLAQARS